MTLSDYRLLRSIGISSPQRIAEENPYELASILQVDPKVAINWVRQSREVSHLPTLDDDHLVIFDNPQIDEEEFTRRGVKHTEVASFLITKVGITSTILKKIDSFGIISLEDFAYCNPQRLASALGMSPEMISEWIRQSQHALELAEI
jgi:hypothetical protein